MGTDVWGWTYGPEAAKHAAALLPEENFAKISDREVVTQLLVNMVVFAHRVKPRSDRQLRSLVREKLEIWAGTEILNLAYSGFCRANLGLHLPRLRLASSLCT